MVSTFISSRVSWATDKMGDAFLYVLDEVKFWGEVVTEFLEIDESSSDRHLREMRERVREQMDETEQYQREVEQIKEQRKRQGLPPIDDGSSEDEVNDKGDDEH